MHVSFVDGRAANLLYIARFGRAVIYAPAGFSAEARMDLIFLFVSTIREEARGVPILPRPISARYSGDNKLGPVAHP
jgi:hypothetical protein